MTKKLTSDRRMLHRGKGRVDRSTQFLHLLLFLLPIRDSPRLGLGIPNLPQVDSYRPIGEWIGLLYPSIFLVGRPEAAHKGIQTAPGLPEGASAGARGLWMPEEHASLHVDLRLPELVEVAHEFQHVPVIALRQRHRWALVPQVLAERVPVAPLLGLVPAQLRRRRRVGGRRRSLLASAVVFRHH